jgi:hypothetical protein
MPYGRERPITNWQVGSQQVDQTGQVVGGFATPTSVPTWNPGASAGTYQLTTGAPKTFQVAVINAAVSGAAPTIGRMRVDEIVGRLLFNVPSVPGFYSIAVGVYVSEFTVNTTAWDVFDPMLPQDGARDDWWLLQAESFQIVTNALAVAGSNANMDIHMDQSITIGGGQAVHLTVSMIGPNASTLFVSPAVRARVGPVA